MAKAASSRASAPLAPEAHAPAGYYDALIAKWGTLTGTTQQKLDQINTLKITGPAIPMIIPTYQIYNVIDVAEAAALTAANQQVVRDICSMGSVDASANTSVRKKILAVFGAGTASRTALTALAAPYDTPQILWWSAPVSQGGGGLSSPVSQADLDACGLS